MMTYAVIISFVASLLAIVLMIYSRILEIRKRKAFFSTKILNTVDWSLNKKATWFKIYIYSYILRVFFFIFSRARIYFFKAVHIIRARIDSAFLRIVIWLRGKRILLKSKGSVSFFLRNISEHNKDWQNGKE